MAREGLANGKHSQWLFFPAGFKKNYLAKNSKRKIGRASLSLSFVLMNFTFVLQGACLLSLCLPVFAEAEQSQTVPSKKREHKALKLVVMGTTLTLSEIPGYSRMDGINANFDKSLQKVAGASGMEILIALSADADVELLRSGQVRPMKRRILIQRNSKVSAALLVKEFQSLRDEFAKEAGILKTSPLNDNLAAREKALNEALAALEPSPQKRLANPTPRMIGFFDEDKSSFCYAMTTSHAIGSPGGTMTVKTNAVCLAVVKLPHMVIMVNVIANLEDKTDMLWAMDMTKQVRDRLLGRR